jgi:hypothetical protein
MVAHSLWAWALVVRIIWTRGLNIDHTSSQMILNFIKNYVLLLNTVVKSGSLGKKYQGREG